MLLQRCINKAPLLALALATLVVAGCGGSSAIRSSSGPDEVSRTEGTSTGDELLPVIPPVVLTLFEQAAASMAGGDFVEAELRFKEFLLQYPEYPGAHVNLAIIHSSNGNDAAARAASLLQKSGMIALIFQSKAEAGIAL